MNRRPALWGVQLVLLVLLAGLLASCGDDDDDNDDAVSPSPDDTASATTTETAAGTTATGTTGSGEDLGDVDVMSVWGDEEETNFRAMVSPWEEDTGGSLQYTGTRDLTQQVTVRVEGNNPPDVVIAPELGVLKELVASGDVVPLSQCGLDSDVMENYPEAFVNLGTVDDELYGVIMKVDNKGTIFYNPKIFDEMGWEPLTDESTFDDLLALAKQIHDDGMTPFSMGIQSDAATGWVITDWIAQILLGQEGLDTYNGLIDGTVPFNDARVKNAWELFGEIVHTDGYVAQPVPDGVVATGFAESTYLPYEDPPEAAMVYLGSFAAGFIAEQFPDLVAGEDYDFMPFPDGAVTGAFNVAYALNDDETTCSFMNYIASADAQQIWVDAGGFNSAHKDIDLSAYDDVVARKAAEGLLEAQVFAGDVDDLVGGDFQTAFFAAGVSFLEDPGSLDSLLDSVEAAR